MCFICDQQAGFETDIAQILQLNQTSSLEISENINSNSANKSIQSSDIIGEITNLVKTDFAGREKIYYYIHDSYGDTFEHYGLHSIEISEPHSSGAEKFIQNVFDSIDGHIELDFERTYSKSKGNIDIYYIGDYWIGDFLGFAFPGDPGDSNIDIVWENSYSYSYINGNYGSLTDQDAFVLIHEIGHALGLAHPQLNGIDDPFGTWHNTDDTVMSYNFIYDESLYYTQPLSWRSADIAALESIWGAETGNTPTSISLSSKSFNENIQVNTSIATLSTTDVDVNDTFTYAFASGAGDTDNSYFTINGSSLKIKSSPDYETKDSYSIRIRTTDSANNSFEQSFILSVNDLNENTILSNTNTNTNSNSSIRYLSIDENKQHIETFTSSKNVTWSISGGEQSLFSINRNTGELTFKTIPDYEKPFEPEGTILEFKTNYSTSTVTTDFYVELYDKQNMSNKTTSITANNFIKYVSDGSYDNTLIHRSVDDFIIQGGGYSWPNLASDVIGGTPLPVQSKGEIINEPGNSNLRGTVGMAKYTNQPDSATSQWFINLSDNINLDSQNEGFTVFGHILGDGIENPLLLNNQSIYNVNYSDTGLNLPELPLTNVQDNVIKSNNYFAIHEISTIRQRPSAVANKYNVIVTSTNSTGQKSNQYVVVEVKDVLEQSTNSTSDISTTTNSSNSNSATSRELQQLYIAYFSRPCDPAGLDYWTDQGISRSAFAANMYLQPEFKNVNGNLSVESQVNQIYLNLFNRNADATGLLYWTSQIEKGALQLASIANDLIWASENNPGGSSDASTLANKTSAAVSYTTQVRTSVSSILAYQAQSTSPWITGNNLTEAKNFISEIGQYNTHTSWGIENSIARFSNSSSSSFKLLSDTKTSKTDAITGLEIRTATKNTFEDTLSPLNSISSNIFDERLLEDGNNQEFVSDLYVENLEREPDSIGMKYWLEQLNSGAETPHEVLLGFTESPEHNVLFPKITEFG